MEEWAPHELPGFENIRGLDMSVDAIAAVRDDGAVVVQGQNAYGALGTGDRATVTSPTVVPAWGSVRELALGRAGTVAVRTSGEALYSGSAPGRLEVLSPAPFPELGAPSRVAANGAFQLCAATGSDVRCGDVERTWWWSPPERAIDAGRGLVVGSGVYPSVSEMCAIGADGRARCGGTGPLGDPLDLAPVDRLALVHGRVWALVRGEVWTFEWRRRDTPVRVDGIRDAVAITSVQEGGDPPSLCATLGSGEVWCWGQNSLGELGDGLGGSSVAIPVTVLHLPR